MKNEPFYLRTRINFLVNMAAEVIRDYGNKIDLIKARKKIKKNIKKFLFDNIKVYQNYQGQIQQAVEAYTTVGGCSLGLYNLVEDALDGFPDKVNIHNCLNLHEWIEYYQKKQNKKTNIKRLLNKK